ncbi:unnamed protein product [Microthlaspi erraticum]|uniref:Reverse transcriptase zinc-binding domain-containing protein n=1 Tax=Microthlaspi erraticum TaxID=1685480 RepID=A0A6D2IGT6_9BRAS|nr:unnamed protein product [Microthlaspi erraticum]CAA7025838.1 unnamed protein product [Microthlaspi erraticum]
MRGARSEEMELFQTFLTTMSAPEAQRGTDIYLWRNRAGEYKRTFSSKSTWEQLRDHSPAVNWFKTVWFKEFVPRCSFITWLAVQNRLPTKDRLRNWGLNVPAACVLCISGTETHDHLFFDCEFSRDIWRDLASRIWQNPPLDLSSVITWILQPRPSPHASASVIIKLLFQAAVYLIWKERNSRIFKNISSTSGAIRVSVDRLIRDRLLSLPSTDGSPSLLEFYFGCIKLFP